MYVRSPLGKVSASAVCESTFDSGLSDNDLTSVSVDELSCSDKEGAKSKDLRTRRSKKSSLQKTSKEKDVVAFVRKRIKEARRKGFILFEEVRENERKEVRRKRDSGLFLLPCVRSHELLQKE
jgi:hypothetical protein